MEVKGILQVQASALNSGKVAVLANQGCSSHGEIICSPRSHRKFLTSKEKFPATIASLCGSVKISVVGTIRYNDFCKGRNFRHVALVGIINLQIIPMRILCSTLWGRVFLSVVCCEGVFVFLYTLFGFLHSTNSENICSFCDTRKVTSTGLYRCEFDFVRVCVN